MEHSLQITQPKVDNSLTLFSPFLSLQNYQLGGLPMGNICQNQSQFQSTLRLDSQEIFSEQDLENQVFGLVDVNQIDQILPISFQVNSQKNQEFFIDLENLLKEQLQIKQADQMKKKICLNTHNCSICHQKVRRKSTVYRLKCRHIFHIKCLDNWKMKMNNCPLCRKYLA